MPNPPSGRTTKWLLHDIAIQVVVLACCGAISGGVIAAMDTLVNWLFISGPPTAIRVSASEHGHIGYMVKMTPVEYSVYLTRILVNEASAGLFWGAVSGLVTAFVSRHWMGITQIWKAALFWALLANSVVFVLRLLSLHRGTKLGEETFWSEMFAIIPFVAMAGAAYGMILALVVRAMPHPALAPAENRSCGRR